MRAPCFSRSDTFEFLTNYAEKILLQRIITSRSYNVRRKNEHTWYIMRDTVDSSSSSKDIIPKFRRVREISLLHKNNLNLLTCSCGGVQRFLMPCSHSIAVLRSLGHHVRLGNIHYRWNKVLSYYIHDDSNLQSNMRSCLLSMVHVMNSIMCMRRKSWYGFPLDDEQTIGAYENVQEDDVLRKNE